MKWRLSGKFPVIRSTWNSILKVQRSSKRKKERKAKQKNEAKQRKKDLFVCLFVLILFLPGSSPGSLDFMHSTQICWPTAKQIYLGLLFVYKTNNATTGWLTSFKRNLAVPYIISLLPSTMVKMIIFAVVHSLSLAPKESIQV